MPLLIAINMEEMNDGDKISIYLKFDSIKVGDVNIDFHDRVNDTGGRLWRWALFVNYIASIVAENWQWCVDFDA